PVAFGIPSQAKTRRKILPGCVVRPIAGIKSGIARIEQAGRRVRVHSRMKIRVEVRLVEMRDPSVENTAREVGLPADAIIQGQARSNLPGVLRVDSEIVPALVIVRDALLRK